MTEQPPHPGWQPPQPPRDQPGDGQSGYPQPGYGQPNPPGQGSPYWNPPTVPLPKQDWGAPPQPPGQGWGATPGGPMPGGWTPGGTGPGGWGQPPPKSSSGRKIAIVAAAVAILLLLGAVAFAVTRKKDKDQLVGSAAPAPSSASTASGSSDSSSADTSASPSASGTNVSPFSLSVGDCLQMPLDITILRSVPKLDCADPHNAQVFTDYDLTDATYPGDAAIKTESLSSCQDKASTYLGTDSTDLHVVALFPQQQRWDTGDRTVHCILVDRTKQITGDIRDDK